MNFIDYFLITVVGLSIVLSLFRGFVREVISLIGLVLAFIVASRVSASTGDYLGQWIPSSTMADIAGFALIFIIVMVVVGIIGALIRKLVDLAALTATDRTLGIFFGAARGMLLIALCFLVYTSYTKPDAAWLKQSTLAPYGIQLGELLGQAIPEGYPFSRQGAAKGVSLQKTNKIQLQDIIPVKDKQALKSILENSK